MTLIKRKMGDSDSHRPLFYNGNEVSMIDYRETTAFRNFCDITFLGSGRVVVVDCSGHDTFKESDK